MVCRLFVVLNLDAEAVEAEGLCGEEVVDLKWMS